MDRIGVEMQATHTYTHKKNIKTNLFADVVLVLYEKGREIECDMVLTTNNNLRKIFSAHRRPRWSKAAVLACVCQLRVVVLFLRSG